MKLNIFRQITEIHCQLVSYYSQGCPIDHRQSIESITAMVTHVMNIPSINSKMNELNLSKKILIDAQVSAIKNLHKFDKPMIKYQGGALSMPSCWLLWNEDELLKLLNIFGKSFEKKFESFFVQAVLTIYSEHLDRDYVGTYMESQESVKNLMYGAIVAVVIIISIVGIALYLVL